MKIDLTELMRKVGNETDLEDTEKVSFAEDGLVLLQPVKLSLHLVNTGLSVLVSGKIETEAELACSRCLKKMRLPLKIDVAEEYSKQPPEPIARKGKLVELKEEDFIYPLGKDNTLDLTEMIRENLLLAIPIKPLCQTACKGE